jgi:hypothetical protein
MTIARKPYPSDVSDEEWSLVMPYLTLMRLDAAQRQHALRELAPSHGPHDAEGWSRTTNAMPAHWRAFTSSPSLASCSNRPLSSPQVHNTL